jgi:hypothetical protein
MKQKSPSQEPCRPSEEKKGRKRSAAPLTRRRCPSAQMRWFWGVASMRGIFSGLVRSSGWPVAGAISHRSTAQPLTRASPWSVPLHRELGENRSLSDFDILRGMLRALRFGFVGHCGHGLVTAGEIAPWIGGGALLSGLRRVEDDSWAMDLVINGRDQIWLVRLGRRARNHRILIQRPLMRTGSEPRLLICTLDL